MMRKIVVHRAGSYERLEIEEHEEPRPDKGDILIEVRAIGINFADCIVRMGLYESAKVYVGWPITPGFEVAGIVKEIGEDVEGFLVGDEVFGVTRFGGYATHLVIPKHQVFHKPSFFSLEESAAFPTVFLTAYYAMFELAHPRKGQDILVHSAAGGVGGALLQLGKIAGLHTTGVVGGSHKVESAREYGAKNVIDKSKVGLWKEAERLVPDDFHVIFDANGVSTLADSYEHLAPMGKLVIYGFHSMMSKGRGRPNWLKLVWGYLRTKRFNPLDMTGENRSVLAFNLSYLFEHSEILVESMTQLIKWIEQGKIKPPPIKTYAFEDIAKAHFDLELGNTVGKLVLTL